MANVLFVCLHNAGRSQMSEALFTRAADRRHRARSAGTQPAERVHPQVVDAMREIGVDLVDRTPRRRGTGPAASADAVALAHPSPRRLGEGLAEWAGVVVPMACGDECPLIPGRTYKEWDLPDPA